MTSSQCEYDGICMVPTIIGYKPERTLQQSTELRIITSTQLQQHSSTLASILSALSISYVNVTYLTISYFNNSDERGNACNNQKISLHQYSQYPCWKQISQVFLLLFSAIQSIKHLTFHKSITLMHYPNFYYSVCNIFAALKKKNAYEYSIFFRLKQNIWQTAHTFALTWIVNSVEIVWIAVFVFVRSFGLFNLLLLFVAVFSLFCFALSTRKVTYFFR